MIDPRRVLVAGLLVGIGAFPPAMAADALPLTLIELDDGRFLRSFSRAPVDGALAGCAIAWTTRDEEGPSPGELSLACLEQGSLERRLLASTEETLRALRVESGAGGALRVLLAHESRIEERLLGTREGRLREPRVLLAERGLGPGALAVRPDFDADGTADLQLHTWRGVEAWRRGPEGYELLSRAVLPPRAAMSPFGPDLTVRGWLIEGEEGVSTRWTRPRTREGMRLSTWRIPLGAEGFGTPCEAWIATPEPLAVQRARFATLGGQELLVAIAQPAESFSIFGEGTLIVAEPRCDETRRGRGPLLVARTSYAPWFPPEIRELEDRTGDGLADIVLVGFSGKLNVNAEVRLHEGRPGGEFAERPRRWEEDADAGALAWDEDLDGDGHEDLVLRDARKLKIYRGVEARPGRVPLENRHTWDARIPRGWETTWIASWAIDEAGRHVVLLGLRGEDDERKRALALVAPPLSASGESPR